MASVRFQVRMALAVLTLGCLGSSPARAQWYVDGAAEVNHNDNVSRAANSIDIREDQSVGGGVGGGYNRQLADYTAVSLLGSLHRTQYERYSGLSNTALNVAIAVKHKFGLGDSVPQLVMNLGTGRDSFNNGNRDASHYTASLSLNKRFTQRLKLSAGLGWTERDGDYNVPSVGANGLPLRPGNPWDVNYWHASLGGELELGRASWLSASYQLQDGDIVSSGTPYGRIFAATTALTRDSMFGDRAVAHRIPARTGSLAVDLNHAVRETGTIFLGVEYQDTQGENDVDYGVGILRAGLLYSF
jgi:hypothetical protein